VLRYTRIEKILVKVRQGEICGISLLQVCTGDEKVDLLFKHADGDENGITVFGRDLVFLRKLFLSYNKLKCVKGLSTSISSDISKYPEG
jgi:hypothetical protein